MKKTRLFEIHVSFIIFTERGEIKMEAKKTMEARELMLGKNVPFQRIRRITGYLVGTMEQWNNAKRAEEHDRVKHMLKLK